VAGPGPGPATDRRAIRSPDESAMAPHPVGGGGPDRVAVRQWPLIGRWPTGRGTPCPAQLRGPCSARRGGAVSSTAEDTRECGPDLPRADVSRFAPTPLLGRWARAVAAHPAGFGRPQSGGGSARFKVHERFRGDAHE